jgi:hypothetical protein
MTNVLDTLGQSIDELFIENTNRLDRVVVPVNTDYSIVFTTGLAVIEEFFAG